MVMKMMASMSMMKMYEKPWWGDQDVIDAWLVFDVLSDVDLVLSDVYYVMTNDYDILFYLEPLMMFV